MQPICIGNEKNAYFYLVLGAKSGKFSNEQLASTGRLHCDLTSTTHNKILNNHLKKKSKQSEIRSQTPQEPIQIKKNKSAKINRTRHDFRNASYSSTGEFSRSRRLHGKKPNKTKAKML